MDYKTLLASFNDKFEALWHNFENSSSLMSGMKKVSPLCRAFIKITPFESYTQSQSDPKVIDWFNDCSAGIIHKDYLPVDKLSVQHNVLTYVVKMGKQVTGNVSFAILLVYLDSYMDNNTDTVKNKVDFLKATLEELFSIKSTKCPKRFSSSADVWTDIHHFKKFLNISSNHERYFYKAWMQTILTCESKLTTWQITNEKDIMYNRMLSCMGSMYLIVFQLIEKGDVDDTDLDLLWLINLSFVVMDDITDFQEDQENNTCNLLTWIHKKKPGEFGETIIRVIRLLIDKCDKFTDTIMKALAHVVLLFIHSDIVILCMEGRLPIQKGAYIAAFQDFAIDSLDDLTASHPKRILKPITT